MDKKELKILIEECCNDIFERLEPLANVKERLYRTLEDKLRLNDVVRQSEQYYCADRENAIEDANCTIQYDYCKDIERNQ